MKLGLRIDVDTLRGTRIGLPALCDLLARRGVKASFFLSVGPDNMGRHLRRLLKPAFLFKMLRTGAPALYGPGILLHGTLRPGPLIGERCADQIRRVADDGHEIGLHAWDHHAWQTRIERMNDEAVFLHLLKAQDAIEKLIGAPPTCSAAPGWRSTDAVLLQKERFRFRYNSDCRGDAPFRPLVGERPLSTPQIPVTLPTYDELVGRDGTTDANYNERLLALLRPDRLNVLTVHAEVEGIAKRPLFENFLDHLAERDVDPVPLGTLLDDRPPPPPGRIELRPFPGREGRLAVQRPLQAPEFSQPLPYKSPRSRG